MQANIHAVEVVFLLLLLFVVAFGALARKLGTPYPIVLVVGGLLLSFIPGIPKITLNPERYLFCDFATSSLQRCLAYVVGVNFPTTLSVFFSWRLGWSPSP